MEVLSENGARWRRVGFGRAHRSKAPAAVVLYFGLDLWQGERKGNGAPVNVDKKLGSFC